MCKNMQIDESRFLMWARLALVYCTWSDEAIAAIDTGSRSLMTPAFYDVFLETSLRVFGLKHGENTTELQEYLEDYSNLGNELRREY